MRILSWAPALDAAVPSAATMAVALAMCSNVRRFAENMSSLLPVSCKRGVRKDERAFLVIPVSFPLFFKSRRPGLDLASTLRFPGAMDRSGKRLHFTGEAGSAIDASRRSTSTISEASLAAFGAEAIEPHYVP